MQHHHHQNSLSHYPSLPNLEALTADPMPKHLACLLLQHSMWEGCNGANVWIYTVLGAVLGLQEGTYYWMSWWVIMQTFCVCRRCTLLNMRTASCLFTAYLCLRIVDRALLRCYHDNFRNCLLSSLFLHQQHPPPCHWCRFSGITCMLPARVTEPLQRNTYWSTTQGS